MWAEKFRLGKQLVRSVTAAGFTSPTEMQLKTLSRINGGQDIIGIGPEGCGKTSTLVIATLNRFDYKADGTPRVLVLAPDEERVIAIADKFAELNKNTSIRIVMLHNGAGTEQQMDDLAEGSDIVIATPDRARAIYLKLGLNLNKVDFLAIDDAHLIVKQGLQLPLVELANSIDKGQHIVFTEVMHDRLAKMLAPFMQQPATVEVDEALEAQVETYPQMLYHVPNFGTKLNLLNLFLYDEEVFTKTVIFTNTRQTAETVYKSLGNRLKKSVAMLNAPFFEYNEVKSITEFKEQDTLRVLIVANESDADVDASGIPFIIHLDIPDRTLYINHVTTTSESDDETIALTFATDMELDQIRKIEQATGNKMQAADLPEDLVIEKDRKQKEAEEEEKQRLKPQPKPDPNVVPRGEAFHQKKPENAKTFNFSSREKAKMTKKRNH